MAADKRTWLQQLGVSVLPAAAPADAGDLGLSGSADGRAPHITVTSNGDGTFTIDGTDFLAKSGALISAADRQADRDYGIAMADADGKFSFTTRNICPSPPPITFTATSGINSKTDRTDWVWSNIVQTACPADKGGSDGSDGGSDDGSDGGGSDGGGSDGGGSDGAGSDGAGSDGGGSDGSDGGGGISGSAGGGADGGTDGSDGSDGSDGGGSDGGGSDGAGSDGAGSDGGGSDGAGSDGSGSDGGGSDGAGSDGSDGGDIASPATVQPTTSPTPGLPRLTQDQLEKIIGTDTSVSREQVERELTDFLGKLQSSQGGKTLKIDDKVRLAGNALSKGLGDSDLQVYSVLQDDRLNVVPNELAQKIAALLPARIPRENFDNFLKLRPTVIKPPEKLSISGAIAKLLTPAVKEAIAGLPKSIREKIEKGIEDAVSKGIVAIVDQAMSDSKLDDQTKKSIHSAVEAAIKEK